LLYRLLPIRLTSRELSGSPKFPGNPRDHSPCSSTPAGPGTRYGTKGQRTRHGPRTKAKRGLLTVASFGAPSHGFWSRCLRLVVVVSHHCTQDSLPAAGPSLAGRDFNPQGFYERFLSIKLVLLSRAFLAQASFWRFSITATSLPCGLVRRGSPDPAVRDSFGEGLLTLPFGTRSARVS